MEFIKNKIMKKYISILLLFLSINVFSQEGDLEWHTDLNKAIEITIESEKPLFMFFTGSDWCGWCIRLQKEVFFKPDFVKWAKENFGNSAVPKWNFHKILIDKNGKIHDTFASFTEPMSSKLVKEIEKVLDIKT